MLCVFLFRVFYNFHALIMNNFKHRVLRIEPINQILLFKSVLLIKHRRREPGRDVKILRVRMLGIKGSTEHSRWTCVDRPS